MAKNLNFDQVVQVSTFFFVRFCENGTNRIILAYRETIFHWKPTGGE